MNKVKFHRRYYYAARRFLITHLDMELLYTLIDMDLQVWGKMPIKISDEWINFDQNIENHKDRYVSALYGFGLVDFITGMRIMNTVHTQLGDKWLR